MANQVKVLEDLVTEAVDRLQNLTHERDRLVKEAGELRERLGVLAREASYSSCDSDADQAWQGRQAQARSILQEALVELQGE